MSGKSGKSLVKMGDVSEGWAFIGPDGIALEMQAKFFLDVVESFKTLPASSKRSMHGVSSIHTLLQVLQENIA